MMFQDSPARGETLQSHVSGTAAAETVGKTGKNVLAERLKTLVFTSS